MVPDAPAVEAPESPVAPALPAGGETAPPEPKAPETGSGKAADPILGLLDRYLKGQTVLTEAYGPQIQAASQETERRAGVAAAESDRVLRPAIEGVKAAASVPVPPLPQMAPEPPVPDRRAKPFLSSKDGESAVSALVTGLGLLGQLAMGGKAPVAALNALTGAMKGWAEGDATRSEREWKQYLQTVDSIRHENAQGLKLWEAAMQSSGTNLLQAEARYKAATAEAGLADKWAAVPAGSMGRLLEMLKYEQGVLDGVMDQSTKVLNMKLMDEHRKAMDANTAAWRQSQLEAQARRQDEVERANREKETERARSSERTFNEKVREFNAKLSGAFSAPSDPKSTDLAATFLLERGAMPQLGAGMAGARMAILKRAAEMLNEGGQTPQDAIARQQLNRATQAALTANMRQTAQLGNFIKTADKIKDQAAALSEAQDRTGVPLFNKWLQAGQRSIAGDEGITRFDLANASIAAEFARVMNSATGGGVSTVDARRHALELLNTAQTKEQYRAAVGQIHQELMARVDSLREESQELQNLTRGKGTLADPTGKGAPEKAAPSEMRVRRKSDGKPGLLKLAPGEKMPAEYEAVK